MPETPQKRGDPPRRDYRVPADENTPPRPEFVSPPEKTAGTAEELTEAQLKRVDCAWAREVWPRSDSTRMLGWQYLLCFGRMQELHESPQKVVDLATYFCPKAGDVRFPKAGDVRCDVSHAHDTTKTYMNEMLQNPSAIVAPSYMWKLYDEQTKKGFFAKMQPADRKAYMLMMQMYPTIWSCVFNMHNVSGGYVTSGYLEDGKPNLRTIYSKWSGWEGPDGIKQSEQEEVLTLTEELICELVAHLEVLDDPRMDAKMGHLFAEAERKQLMDALVPMICTEGESTGVHETVERTTEISRFRRPLDEPSQPGWLVTQTDERVKRTTAVDPSCLDPTASIDLTQFGSDGARKLVYAS